MVLCMRMGGCLAGSVFFFRCGQALNLETETEVKYNNSYQALYRQLKDVFTKIGATDFFGVVGEKFVYTRHEKVCLVCTKGTQSNPLLNTPTQSNKSIQLQAALVLLRIVASSL